MSDNWVRVCQATDIDEEDLMRFDHGGKTYCIYHTDQGFYATDGMCTHQEAHLETGFVMGTIIECPLHQGQFDIPSGKAMTTPVCVDLKTYDVSLVNGEVFLNVG